MNVFLNQQNDNFEKHLNELKEQSVQAYDKSSLSHKVSSRFIRMPFSSLAFTDFFNYHIFPNSILQAYPQWVHEKRSMSVGDTILQQIQIPPLPLSLKMIIGVRICAVVDTVEKKSFAYETLTGHVEKGISTFIIEPYNEGSLFTIKTYSEPALVTLKALKFFSLKYQQYCTNRALDNVAANLIKRS